MINRGGTRESAKWSAMHHSAKDGRFATVRDDVLRLLRCLSISGLLKGMQERVAQLFMQATTSRLKSRQNFFFSYFLSRAKGRDD